MTGLLTGLYDGRKSGMLRGQIPGLITGLKGDVPILKKTATYFDGVNDYVNFGTGVLNASQGTISMKIKLLKNHTGSQRIFSDIGGGFIYLEQQSGGINLFRFLIYDGGNKFSGMVPLSVAVWTNLLCVWQNGQTLKIYRNGTAFAGPDATGNIADVVTYPFAIGSIVSGAFAVNVLISQAEVWSVGMTALQAAEYNTTTNPFCHSAASGLTHAYAMGTNDTYPTIKDRKGTKNGTMTNMLPSNFIYKAAP